jgi:hypothetical protein
LTQLGGTLGPPGAGLGATGRGSGSDEASSQDEDDAEDDASLSKRAAKKLRKRERVEAEAIAETPITTGFGHAMLLKMGWGGQGEGLREGGIAEPVKAAPPAGKRGLTADDDYAALGTAGSDAQDGATGAAAACSERESAQPAKRPRKDPAPERSRTWTVELELSAPADEAAVRTAMLSVPSVLWVPKLERTRE